MLRQLGLRIALAVLACSIAAHATAASPLHQKGQPFSAASPQWAPPPPAYLLLEQAGNGRSAIMVGRPYAYGWFGVAPRRHTITHRGYYGGHWLSPGQIAP